MPPARVRSMSDKRPQRSPDVVRPSVTDRRGVAGRRRAAGRRGVASPGPMCRKPRDSRKRFAVVPGRSVADPGRHLDGYLRVRDNLAMWHRWTEGSYGHVFTYGARGGGGARSPNTKSGDLAIWPPVQREAKRVLRTSIQPRSERWQHEFAAIRLYNSH